MLVDMAVGGESLEGLRGSESERTEFQDQFKNYIEKDLAASDSSRTSIAQEGTIDWRSLFETFVEVCLVHMIGKRTWREKKFCMHISSLFTPADEALAVVLMENNAEDWRTVAKDSDRKNVSRQNRKRKYTHQKVKAGELDSGKGWAWVGIKRYNKILKKVKDLRKVKETAEMHSSVAWEKELFAKYFLQKYPDTAGGSETSLTSDGMSTVSRSVDSMFQTVEDRREYEGGALDCFESDEEEVIVPVEV